MPDYSFYIAVSYGFTAAVLGGITLYTVIGYRRAARSLAELEKRRAKNV